MIVPFGGIGEGTSDGEQGQGGRAGGGGQGEAGEAVDVRDRQRPGHAGPEALLHEASGRADAAVADKTGAGVDAAGRCVARYESGGLEAALADAPGRGRRRETSESDGLWAVS